MMAENMTVRISDDALARALGADDLAAAFARKGCSVDRTSSWGMQWLEPLVEINGVGWGPATLEDVDDIVAGGGDEICIGPIAAHPFIANQQRLTFARAGKTRPLSLEDYEATGGWAGLKRARQIGSARISRGSDPVGPARPRRRGLPGRDQVADRRPGAGRAEIHRLQRRRRR